MNSREIVWRTIRFQGAERLPLDLPEKYGSDFELIDTSPALDARPRSGVDEWGAVWVNLGSSNLGEVKDYPLKEWADFDKLSVPNVHDPRRWTLAQGARARLGDKFLLGGGISIYERAHFLRGLENIWMDIHEHPQELGRLLDLLVDMNLAAIKYYAAADFDGFIFPDDWGLQNRLMISPVIWRKVWKPRYARIYEAAHGAGLATFLHSCGYIIDILDDLIEIGLDVINMDQQENMGLELLGVRFGGRITFYSPVDIQKTMATGSLDDIRLYCRRMARWLGRPAGGFIPKWYLDPVGAGHRSEAIEAMCEEFLRISAEKAAPN